MLGFSSWDEEDYIPPLNSSAPDFFDKARAELDRALALHGELSSLHEGYAVLLEEVDELWDIVKQKHSERDITALKSELIQIAAMAGKIAQLFEP